MTFKPNKYNTSVNLAQEVSYMWKITSLKALEQYQSKSKVILGINVDETCGR